MKFDFLRPDFLHSGRMHGMLVLFACWAGALGADHPLWSQFRGPEGSGVMKSSPDLTAIGDASKLRWRVPLRGVGWSSPVSDGERFFVTSSITEEATEAEREAALANVKFADIKDVAGSVELLAVALDADTGTRLWERSLAQIEEPNPIHPMNSYASPTPLVTEHGVVFHFGGYGTWCLDPATGMVRWTQRLVVDDSVGPGSSPVRFGDTMLVACDGIDRQFVAALSLVDGSIIWKTPRPEMRASNPEFRKAYSTPLMIDVEGQVQAVVPGAQWVVAYDPNDGREIWRADYGNGFSTTPMALYVDGLVLFSTGYVRPELVAVDPRGRGDVTQTHIRWRNPRGAPAKPSLINDGDWVYLISDDGILSACSATTGRSAWRKRIGGTFSASPVRSGHQILIANHSGDVTVFRSGGEYQEIKSVSIDEQIMASPITHEGDLIIRTRDAVYRFRGQ